MLSEVVKWNVASRAVCIRILRAPFVAAAVCVLLLYGCGASGDQAEAGGAQSNSEAPQNLADSSAVRARERASQANFCTEAAGVSPSNHIVTGWKTTPGDALITHPISGLTVRQSIAPLGSGEVIRLKLSNRYASVPVTLDSVHLATESEPGSADMVPDTTCQLRFGGESQVQIAAGETVYSDWVNYPVNSFERIGISFFAPGLTPQLTRHLNGLEVLYMSVPGNYAADPSGEMFQPVPDGFAANLLIVEAIETLASKAVSTIVAVGDSITDGSDASTGAFSMEASPMTATDQRYPDHLQRRINEAGLPFTVANSGIGGSELLADAWPPQFGKSLLNRLEYDVLEVAGASHVLLMIGTNDFGNPKRGLPPTSEDMIEGYKKMIERVQAAGMKIILGTIPPAEGAVVEGVFTDLGLPSPEASPVPIGVLHGTAQARRGRDEVNDWIRSQTLSDGVIDFEACLEDPNREGYLAPEYNSGDNLHPNPAGYAAMADCVDLSLFAQGQGAAQP